MKRLMLIFMFGVAISLQAQQMPSSFDGRWWLAMLEEAQLPINLTFNDGTPVLYSPVQTKEPMTASKWSFSGDTLRVTHSQTGVKLTLVWNAKDSTFAGTFRQGLMRAQITFEPAEGMFTLNRPQTPLPPFPYTSEEVIIVRKKAGVTLAGTLTIPEGKGPFPAVVLVSGSGQQNRDEELLGHKPFLVLADYLTRNGIAVLRYDDRGIGGSKGEVQKATTLDFADDAEAVFDFLRKHKLVDSKRVGIIGHSEGGMIAPIVASRNGKVAFIVLLAGLGCSGADILLQQIERIYQLQGTPQELIDRRLDFTRSVFDISDTVSDYSSAVFKLNEQKTQGLTAEQRKQAGMSKSDTYLMISQMDNAWMKAFVKLNSTDYLARTRCPILAINGDKDCQVLPLNLGLISNATGGKAVIRLMPGLNHLMQHCDTGAPSEYMLIDETMAPEVLQIVAEWVVQTCKTERNKK